MEINKFEKLLKKDRNWLSKYGGFITLFIILIFLFGIFYVQIPIYKPVNTEDDQILKIELNKHNEIGEVGDTIKMKSLSQGDIYVQILNYKTLENSKIIYFEFLDKNIKVSDLKVVVEEKSLLKTLLTPLLPNKS